MTWIKIENKIFLWFLKRIKCKMEDQICYFVVELTKELENSRWLNSKSKTKEKSKQNLQGTKSIKSATL